MSFNVTNNSTTPLIIEGVVINPGTTGVVPLRPVLTTELAAKVTVAYTAGTMDDPDYVAGILGDSSASINAEVANGGVIDNRIDAVLAAGILDGGVIDNAVDALITAYVPVFPTATAAHLADKAHAINTTGKTLYKPVMDSTNHKLYYAIGTADTGKWRPTNDFSGTGDITPA